MDHGSIDKRLELLAASQEEFKTKKQILADSMTGDDEFMALDDKAKDAKTRLAAHKAALMNEPASRKLQEDLKDLAQEIKEAKQLLGDELLAYFMANNTLEYVDLNGLKRKFSVSAKLLAGRGE